MGSLFTLEQIGRTATCRAVGNTGAVPAFEGRGILADLHSRAFGDARETGESGSAEERTSGGAAFGRVIDTECVASGAWADVRASVRCAEAQIVNTPERLGAQGLSRRANWDII